MDLAVLGEIRDGREVVRFVAGDGSFGLAPGASMPIEDTYCHRLLTGRLSNVVADTNADDQLRELPITRAAGSVPTSAFPSRPSTRASTCSAVWRTSSGQQLGKRDVLFLRCLTDAIVDELEQRQTLETDLIRETP